jgi:hypothetical protein
LTVCEAIKKDSSGERDYLRLILDVFRVLESWPVALQNHKSGIGDFRSFLE